MERIAAEEKSRKSYGSILIPQKPVQSMIMPIVKSFSSKAKVSKKAVEYDGDEQYDRDLSPADFSTNGDNSPLPPSAKKLILKSIFRSKSTDNSVLGKRVERCRKMQIRGKRHFIVE